MDEASDPLPGPYYEDELRAARHLAHRLSQALEYDLIKPHAAVELRRALEDYNASRGRLMAPEKILAAAGTGGLEDLPETDEMGVVRGVDTDFRRGCGFAFGILVVAIVLAALLF